MELLQGGSVIRATPSSFRMAVNVDTFGGWLFHAEAALRPCLELQVMVNGWSHRMGAALPRLLGIGSTDNRTEQNRKPGGNSTWKMLFLYAQNVVHKLLSF